jgi:hypothetical protein
MRGVIALVLSSLACAACGKGRECDACRDDGDCRAGFVCSTFSDGVRRCGSGTGATNCRL